ncbi:MAG: hypothetical protein ACK56I_14320, partial [bacterium]
SKCSLNSMPITDGCRTTSLVWLTDSSTKLVGVRRVLPFAFHDWLLHLYADTQTKAIHIRLKHLDSTLA